MSHRIRFAYLKLKSSKGVIIVLVVFRMIPLLDMLLSSSPPTGIREYSRVY